MVVDGEAAAVEEPVSHPYQPVEEGSLVGEAGGLGALSVSGDELLDPLSLAVSAFFLSFIKAKCR